MALNVTPLESIIRLGVQVGTDENDNPIIRNRSYDQVKPSATDQDVYDVASALGSLQKYTILKIIRENAVELTQI